MALHLRTPELPLCCAEQGPPAGPPVRSPSPRPQHPTAEKGPGSQAPTPYLPLQGTLHEHNLGFNLLFRAFSTNTLNLAVVGTSLVVQWLRLHTLNAGGPGLIPGQQ